MLLWADSRQILPMRTRKKRPSTSPSVLQLDQSPITGLGSRLGGGEDRGSCQHPDAGIGMRLTTYDTVRDGTRVCVRNQSGELIAECIVTAAHLPQFCTLLGLLTPLASVSPPSHDPVEQSPVLRLVQDSA